MSRVTAMIAVSNAGQENLGVKLEVPATSVDPGEEVRIYLWGRDEESLRGYALAQGADAVGAARLAQYPGQTEAALFDLDGSGGLKAFSWPVLQLLSVEAVGALYVVDGNDVRRVADPGDDVTASFRLSGNALAPAVGTPKAIGTVRATGARSPWCLEWRWTTPPKPAAGLPAGTCSDDGDDRDSTLYWFFLMRFGALVQEFSLALSINEEFVWDDEDMEDGGDGEFEDYGTVWAQLSWNTLDDLDLWVIDPCGNRIYYGNREEVCDDKYGSLDIDANAGMATNVTETPVERIAWEIPARGEYTVIVSFYLSDVLGKTVDFDLLVQTGHGLVALHDSITYMTGFGDDIKTMLSFVY